MVFLLCTVLIFTTGLPIAVLTHIYNPLSEVVGYIIVVLLCLYAFGFSCSWLYVKNLTSSYHRTVFVAINRPKLVIG